MNRREEIALKERRVRDYLTRRGLGGVVLFRQDNFAWLTAGSDNHVVTGAEAGVIGLLITPDGKFVLANRIESARAMAEEMEGLGYELREYPWYEPGAALATARAAAGEGLLVGDVAGFGELLDEEFNVLRYALTDGEIERYRVLGRLTTEAMVAACHSIRPGLTEFQIATTLGGLLTAQGVEPRVLLVATDDRIFQFRHPIPTQKTLDRYAMLVVGAVKWGLTVSITRFVRFGPLDDDLAARWRAVNRIAAYFTLATRPGRTYADVFRAATELYGELGYPDEWQLHHQGGPTGYRGREFMATFATAAPVVENQAVAWNPSITGTKSEDTMIVSSAGHAFVTRAGAWPMVTVEHAGSKLDFADVLIR